MRGAQLILCGLLTASMFCAAHCAVEAQTVSNPPEQQAEGGNPGTSSPDRRAKTPFSLTFTAIADSGPDQYGIWVFQRGNWLFENINWVDRSGSDALSAFFVGRRFHAAHGLELTVLAGPWYEYADRAWDEAVIDTNVRFQGAQFRFVSVNHWGVPLKATGGFFESHNQSISGIPRVPSWLGASMQVKRSNSSGIERLWAGPMFTEHKGKISLGGVPYWDFLHKRCGLRMIFSYQVAQQKR